MTRTRRVIFRQPQRGGSTRRAVAALAMAMWLVTGCTPKTEKAQQWETLADQQTAAGAAPAAAESLKRALKYDSNDANRWLKLARAERMRNNVAMSAQAYQRALELAPDNVEALQALAILQVRTGRFDEAKRYVSTLMTLSPNDVAGTLAQGAIALSERRYGDADKAADILIANAPQLSDGYVLKARVMDERGDPRHGAALLRTRLPLDPDNVDLAQQTLKLYQKSGDRSGIQAAALELARLVPDDPRYQLEAARALRAKGDQAGAAGILTALTKRYAANPAVVVGIAWQYRDILPQPAAAAKIAELAGAVATRSRAALIGMLTDMGETKRALALAQGAAAQAASADTVDLIDAYAGVLIATGRAAEARAQAAKVLAYDPSDVGALLIRAREAGQRRDFAPAINDAQLALAGDPDNDEAALLIAQLYAKAGNGVLAAKAFGDAQRLFPDDFGIHRERIQWLRSQGRLKEATPLAVSFAQRHEHSPPAWLLLADVCHQANDRACETFARKIANRS